MKYTIIAIASVLLLVSTTSTIGVYTRLIKNNEIQHYVMFKNEIRAQIPESAKVLSSSRLQPHFLGYEKADVLKEHIDLESEHDYIVVYLREPSVNWPDGVYESFIEEYKDKYEILYEDKNFLLLKAPENSET